MIGASMRLLQAAAVLAAGQAAFFTPLVAPSRGPFPQVRGPWQLLESPFEISEISDSLHRPLLQIALNLQMFGNP